MTDADLQGRFSAQFPAVVIHSWAEIHGGQNNVVCVANGRLAVRFARYASATQSLRREIELLRHIGPRVTLAVPVPAFVPAEMTAPDAAFFAYELLPGLPLTGEVLATTLRQGAADTVARQLTTFMRELHGLRMPGSPNLDGRAGWQSLFDRIRDRLFSFMRADARESVLRHFMSCLADTEFFRFEPVLRHGDLGGSNILFDSTTGQLSGVIDFDSAGMGDPAVDYAAIRASLGEEFYQRCLAIEPAMAAADDRARFYRGTFALQEALFGLEFGDHAAFEAGIASYR